MCLYRLIANFLSFYKERSLAKPITHGRRNSMKTRRTKPALCAAPPAGHAHDALHKMSRL